MKPLRIKDNSSIRKELFSNVPLLTKRIADKTLKQLEREGVFVFPDLIRDAEDIEEDQMILQSVNDTYRSSNVMGFLGCGNEQMVIESRFSAAGQDLSLIHISEPTRQAEISYAVFCLKKKKQKKKIRLHTGKHS